MEKLKELIEEAKSINTDDPAAQRRYVAVFDEIFRVLEARQEIKSGCSCGPLD